MDIKAKTQSESSKEVRRQKRVQRKIDASDRRKPSQKAQDAMQAGARRYPVPPFPKQHHPKPGAEWCVEPKPLYDAPF
jgi:hypothetical protein